MFRDADGFVVVDVETTGLSPRADRVIELGIVHLDHDGVETGRWETLLNPGRDLGPQRIHGIRALDVIDAPSFADVAPELVGLLDGRVPVAHNASFDARFLVAELERAGVAVGTPPEFLCTMRIAPYFLPGGGRALGDCCAAYDIPLDGAHRALDDARATGRLLAAFLQDARSDVELQQVLAGYGRARWPAAANATGRGIPWKPRPDPAEPTGPAFLARIGERMPPIAPATFEATEYLALLDRALRDRVLEPREIDELVACAERLDIDRASVQSLHRDYFTALTRVAWEDGILTEDEIDELLAVAELLELPTPVIERALDPHRATRILFEPRTRPIPLAQFALAPGDVVVLTGEMRRPRAAWEAELRAAGLVVDSAVTRRTRLLVAADPDSLSGKARKARDYDVLIVSEPTLESLLALMSAA